MTENDTGGRRRSDSQDVEASIRILVVDDDAAYLRYLRHVLYRAEFAVEVAMSGEEAIERVRKQPQVDILLIDLAMPGLDGIDTVRRIHQEALAPGLYTILISANTAAETRLRAFENGLDDYLAKSSGDSEIVAKLRSAARRVELERRMSLANQELQTLALTDELTGVANRRALFRSGGAILESGKSLSLVLFDLNRFKEINDTHGHLAGDRVLAGVAAALKTHTRFGDIIGRYGGDEFYLLLPETTPEEARQIAERLSAIIRQLRWTLSDKVVGVTAQFGVAGSSAGSTISDLLAACDGLLYRAKRRPSLPRRPEEERPEVR
jgi:diguanylate cyclase (GGDEF)-like protein